MVRPQKERKIGSEAPAVRIKMLSDETKVIGMMADKVQVMLSLSEANALRHELLNVIQKHREKSLIYTFCSEPIEATPRDFTSTDCVSFGTKFGVLQSDDQCQNAVFIINKDGEIVYKEVAEALDSSALDEALDRAIKFKKKGHTHENWMGV